VCESCNCCYWTRPAHLSARDSHVENPKAFLPKLIFTHQSHIATLLRTSCGPPLSPSFAQLILGHRAYCAPSLGDRCTDHPVTRNNTPAQRTTVRTGFVQAGLLFCVYLVLFTYGDLKVINIYCYFNFLPFRCYCTSQAVLTHTPAASVPYHCPTLLLRTVCETSHNVAISCRHVSCELRLPVPKVHLGAV
jgi:hypothetical protein